MTRSAEHLAFSRSPSLRCHIRRVGWAAPLLWSLLILAAPGVASAQALEGALRAWDGRDEIRMPLVSETLRVHIDRQHADTTLRQTYQNETASPVEGRYALVADQGARVEGFAYWNGEEKIVGEVFERDAARAVYEEITGFGRDPGLLEQRGEGSFTFRVFPIAAGEPKRVEVRYGQWLTQHGKTIEYRAPLRRGDASVVVDLEEDRPIRALRSPTHELRIQRRSARQAEVFVEGRRADGGELVLRYDVDEPAWALHARVHRDAGQDPYVLVSVAVPEPDVQTPPPPRDVTLVLDRSGSMGGQPIAQARRAALELIGRLRASDRINILAFDDGFERLYPRPRRLSESVREEALSYVARIDSGGGTDIASALRAALAAQHEDERAHLVLFLTDGQSDARAAIEAAREDPGDARIYTIGVGSGVERALLSQLASHHRGRFTFIPSAEAITDHMRRLYEQLATPVLVGTELELDGIRPYRQYPQSLPDLYLGDELVVAMRLLRGGEADITLRGQRQGRPFALAAHIEVPDAVLAPWVGRAWAQRRAQNLLEEIALHGEDEGRREEVIELALAYSFVTPYTSFLAIPESEMTASTRAQVASMRERRQAILRANPDAAALSRSAMPPGDPILRVRAPADARQVTAYFPFGLELDLHYDTEEEQWLGRFLVPNDVEDGDYAVRVLIVNADGGEARIADVPYTIESDEPEALVEAERVPEGVRVRVSLAAGPIRLARAALASDPRHRIVLAPDESGSWTGVLPLGPSESAVLRVVVADEARNETLVELEAVP